MLGRTQKPSQTKRRMFQTTRPLYKHVVCFPRYKFYESYKFQSRIALKEGQELKKEDYVAVLHVDDVEVRVDVCSQVTGKVTKVSCVNGKSYLSGSLMYEVDDGKSTLSYHDWNDDWRIPEIDFKEAYPGNSAR